MGVRIPLPLRIMRREVAILAASRFLILNVLLFVVICCYQLSFRMKSPASPFEPVPLLLCMDGILHSRKQRPSGKNRHRRISPQRLFLKHQNTVFLIVSFFYPAETKSAKTILSNMSASMLPATSLPANLSEECCPPDLSRSAGLFLRNISVFR